MPATESVFAALLKRDRLVVIAALAIMALMAWAYLLWLSTHMTLDASAFPAAGAMAAAPDGMAGMSGMGDAAAPVFRAWGAAGFAIMFAMWSVMMVGMMTPSAAPMILIYARVGRQAAGEGEPFASTAWFSSGYLAAWTGFAFLATAAQWALERIALLTPMMASASPVFGGLILIAAGLYQLTPLKNACLSQCQAPFAFIQRHGGFRREPQGALMLGLRHGAYCIGCCWALMALLFVGGVMNLLWIAGLAILVLVEKIAPAGRLLSRLAGAALIVAGAVMVYRDLSGH
jgi:predicted metal-binding membrane protein